MSIILKACRMLGIESASQKTWPFGDDVAASVRDNFRANLTRLLEKRLAADGLSQEDFAEAHGISSNKLSKWKSGETFPRTSKEIDELAKLLGVTPDDLLSEPTTIRARDLLALLQSVAGTIGYEVRRKQ